jgi:hypothetical protein
LTAGRWHRGFGLSRPMILAVPRRLRRTSFRLGHRSWLRCGAMRGCCTRTTFQGPSETVTLALRSETIVAGLLRDAREARLGGPSPVQPCPQGRRGLPRISAPRVARISAPRVARISAPRVARISAPRVARISAPRVPRISAPRVARISAPRVARISAPRVARISAPSLPARLPFVTLRPYAEARSDNGCKDVEMGERCCCGGALGGAGGLWRGQLR